MLTEEEYANVALFEGISPENLKQLLFCIKSFKKHFEKDENIIMEKDKVPYIGIVLKGGVHLIKNDIWGNETLLSFIQEGELFGENFAVMKMPESSVTFKASADTDVLFLAAANIIHTCPNSCSFHAKIAENMFHLLGQKSLSFMNKIEIMSKDSMRGKLLAYISMLSQQQNSRYVTSPLSRTQLADYLSVNRSAMTRELGKMRDEGIIDFDKNTFIIKK
ncbi:MAG: Crp/Fnr family transcriptional regulator [Pseudobutyrivibrio sp.]|nr:Crp/Fnr family transcriptional regulator [Pseudobutyrivibrio sp.]